MSQNLSVTIVGLGGIGTRVAEPVVRFLAHFPGEHALTCVDGDRFSESNRKRQNFSRSGNKAEAIQRELSELFPGLAIKAVSEHLTDENAPFIVVENEIVLVCVDNNKSRKRVAVAARTYCQNVTIISGGNDYWDGNVQLSVRRNGVELTPILDDPRLHPEIADPTDKAPDELGCDVLAETSVPQLVFTNQLAAALICATFHQLVTNETELVVTYNELFFDLRRGVVRPRKFAPLPSIPSTSVHQEAV